MKPKYKIVQISNIAPQATKDQMSSLFGYLGKIEDIRLYPTIRDVAIPILSRICFIKFQDRDTAGVSQHLTNTVFIDRALIVIPYISSEMPDEKIAMDVINSNSALPGLGADAKWPPHVTNHIDGIILRTIDPYLTDNGLPEYPNLPATTESHKVNEIRRTLMFDNIDSKASTEDVLSLAERAGQVKYLRMGIVLEGFKNSLVEYAEQVSIINALKLHHTEFYGQPIKVSHSTVAIIKPQTKSNEAAQREIEEAMRRVKESQNIFNTNMDPLAFLEATAKEKFSHSRSRSRSRSHHSRSKRSRSRRSRSRSRSHRKSRSRSRSRRHRSRSHKRSHSRTKKSSRSRSSSRRRSRSRTRKSRSKSRSSRKDKDKSRDKRRDKDLSSKDKKSGENKAPTPSLGVNSDAIKKDDLESAIVKLVEVEDGTEKKAKVKADGGEKATNGLGSEETKDDSQKTKEKDRGVKDKDRDDKKEKDEKKKDKDKKSSRSKRSRSRSSSRSRDRKGSRRSRTRSKSRERRSRRSHRSRSRSLRRSRSRSRSRRDRSRDRRRSRTPDRRRRSPSPVKSRKSSHRDRSRSRDRKERKDREKEKDRDKDREKRDKKKEKKEDRKKETTVIRNYDEEDEMYSEAKKAAVVSTKEKDESHETAVDMDISDSP